MSSYVWLGWPVISNLPPNRRDGAGPGRNRRTKRHRAGFHHNNWAERSTPPIGGRWYNPKQPPAECTIASIDARTGHTAESRSRGQGEGPGREAGCRVGGISSIAVHSEPAQWNTQRSPRARACTAYTAYTSICDMPFRRSAPCSRCDTPLIAICLLWSGRRRPEERASATTNCRH